MNKYYVVTANAVKAPSFKETPEFDAARAWGDVVPTLDGGFKIQFFAGTRDVNGAMSEFHKYYHDLHLRVFKDSITVIEHDPDNVITLFYDTYTDEYCTNMGKLFELAGFDMRWYKDCIFIIAVTDKQKSILNSLRFVVE